MSCNCHARFHCAAPAARPYFKRLAHCCCRCSLLRPELVRAHPRPLCSDGFLRIMRTDPLHREHHAELREAAARLRMAVRAAASQLDQVFAAGSAEDGSASTAVATSLVRSFGVNMRRLGDVRQLCRLPKVRCRPGAVGGAV